MPGRVLGVVPHPIGQEIRHRNLFHYARRRSEKLTCVIGLSDVNPPVSGAVVARNTVALYDVAVHLRVGNDLRSSTEEAIVLLRSRIVDEVDAVNGHVELNVGFLFTVLCSKMKAVYIETVGVKKVELMICLRLFRCLGIT